MIDNQNANEQLPQCLSPEDWASEALHNLDGDYAFKRNPGPAVSALFDYALENGHGEDVLAPLNAYLRALGALADTEDGAAVAVQKLVEAAGLNVTPCCT